MISVSFISFVFMFSLSIFSASTGDHSAGEDSRFFLVSPPPEEPHPIGEEPSLAPRFQANPGANPARRNRVHQRRPPEARREEAAGRAGSERVGTKVYHAAAFGFEDVQELVGRGRTVVYYWTRPVRHPNFQKMHPSDLRLLKFELGLLKPSKPS